ncbi:carboxymuconolactone decarboxylase family protein [Desulfovibrio ferrophilus]|uniref:Alkylhydroperoxidase like protein, AhpD family n=1 Tax=Desulfovibrio ferrophilus TaxID=241368 RepID=A0A2Z6AWV3_9BACT|nr:carboxymuconolactone decarboxylase family protein [Desulfovibrio ferrophilus]BBD07734.1 alkylhydroperoxidase like protein, AhpD family [Desulfovibrio ferrophilus]
MIESQVELKQSIANGFELYKKLMPEIAAAYDELPAETYKDGALTGKEKRLMAMVAALVGRCRACIIYQLDYAIELGATQDEILEACAVAISLGGTMAAGEVTRVMHYLDETDLLNNQNV